MKLQMAVITAHWHAFCKHFFFLKAHTHRSALLHGLKVSSKPSLSNYRDMARARAGAPAKLWVQEVQPALSRSERSRTLGLAQGLGISLYACIYV